MRQLVALVVLAACNVGELVLPDAHVPTDAASDAPGAGLSITPAMHDYGSISIGAMSGAVAFTVSTGSVTGPLAVSLAGANAGDFAILTGNCDGIALAPQSPCTVFVALRPMSVGAKTAQLVVSGTPGGTVSSALSGTGALGAQVQTITPASFPFANVATGGASATKRFTVTNTGADAVGPMTAVLTGIDASQFEIIPQLDTCSTTINNPGASCTVDVRFVPTSIGPKSASLAISPLAGSTLAPLSGMGVMSAQLAITPSPKNFGTVGIGTSVTGVFTIQNTGSVASTPLVTSTSGAADYAIVAATDTCAGAMLAPNATCTLQVRFTPANQGTRTAQLAVGDGSGPTQAQLVGVGVFGDGPGIVPNPWSFGDTRVGTTSAPRTFSITNSGGSAMGALALSKSGTDPNQFQIVPALDHCSGVALAPGATCTFDVVFAPTFLGGRYATVQTFATPGGASTAQVSGTGTDAVLEIAPLSRDFGAVGIGMVGGDQLFTVTNASGIVVTSVTTQLTGTHASDFAIAGGSDTCTGTALAPGAQCSLRVHCAPMTSGPKAAALTVGGGGTLPTEAGLSCSAVNIDPLSITPTILTFTNVVAGTTSAPQSATLQNQGTGTFTSVVPSVVGPAASQYAIDPASTCLTAMVPAGGTCTTIVRFVPTSVGTKTASVQILVPGFGQVNVALNGTAVDP